MVRAHVYVAVAAKIGTSRNLLPKVSFRLSVLLATNKEFKQ